MAFLRILFFIVVQPLRRWYDDIHSLFTSLRYCVYQKRRNIVGFHPVYFLLLEVTLDDADILHSAR